MAPSTDDRITELLRLGKASKITVFIDSVRWATTFKDINPWWT